MIDLEKSEKAREDVEKVLFSKETISKCDIYTKYSNSELTAMYECLNNAYTTIKDLRNGVLKGETKETIEKSPILKSVEIAYNGTLGLLSIELDSLLIELSKRNNKK